jgi:hypothetical protein
LGGQREPGGICGGGQFVEPVVVDTAVSLGERLFFDAEPNDEVPQQDRELHRERWWDPGVL